VRELEVLYKNGIRFFYFSDDAFTMSKERVIEICRRIIEKDLKITWFAISRVTYVNEEVLFWMRKAGCLQISYGIESGSEKIRGLNKRIRPAHQESICPDNEVWNFVSLFIYGSPGENCRLSGDDRPHACDQTSLAQFSTSWIFSGTELYEHLKKNRYHRCGSK
jgi:hypothetical protein